VVELVHDDVDLLGWATLAHLDRDSDDRRFGVGHDLSDLVLAVDRDHRRVDGADPECRHLQCQCFQTVRKLDHHPIASLHTVTDQVLRRALDPVAELCVSDAAVLETEQLVVRSFRGTSDEHVADAFAVPVRHGSDLHHRARSESRYAPPFLPSRGGSAPSWRSIPAIS